MSGPSDRFLAVAGNDPGRARRIRLALERLQQSEDPGLRRLADDVLSGRRDYRDIPADQAFDRALSDRMPRFLQQWEHLDDTERERLVAEGKQQRRLDRAQEADDAAARRRSAGLDEA